MPTTILTAAEYPEWDAFVATARGGSLFHASWYLAALTSDFQLHVVRDSAGRIESGVAITPSRFLLSRGTRRLPWAVYNAPLVRASQKGGESSRASEEKQALVALLSELPRTGFFDFLLAPELTDLMPYLWAGFDTLVGYTYQIHQAEGADWRAAMTSDCRRKLGKANTLLAESGGRVSHESAIDDDCFRLLMDTGATKGFEYGFDRDTLQRWWGAVAAHGQGSVHVVRGKSGEALSCALLVWDERCAWYLGGGMRPEVRSGALAGLNRLAFEQMIDETLRAGRVFDFEGSVIPGVERFMRDWGGRLVMKHRVVKFASPVSTALWSAHRWWTRHRKPLSSLAKLP